MRPAGKPCAYTRETGRCLPPAGRPGIVAQASGRPPSSGWTWTIERNPCFKITLGQGPCCTGTGCGTGRLRRRGRRLHAGRLHHDTVDPRLHGRLVRRDRRHHLFRPGRRRLELHQRHRRRAARCRGPAQSGHPARDADLYQHRRCRRGPAAHHAHAASRSGAGHCGATVAERCAAGQPDPQRVRDFKPSLPAPVAGQSVQPSRAVSAAVLPWAASAAGSSTRKAPRSRRAAPRCGARPPRPRPRAPAPSICGWKTASTAAPRSATPCWTP